MDPTETDAYRRGVEAARTQRRRAIDGARDHVAQLERRNEEDPTSMYYTENGRTFSRLPELAFTRWALANLEAAEAADRD